MTALPGTEGRRRIYLMRHGHVDYLAPDVRDTGLENVPLTELGREQIAAAGDALAHVPFDRVISSGLPRTQQSAEIVVDRSDEFQDTVEIRPALKEIGSGRPLGADDRQSLINMMVKDFSRAAEEGARFLHGGELFSDAYARSTTEIETILAEPDWHTALVVAHEGINRLLLGWATGNGLQAIHSFEQDLGCINVLDFDLNGIEQDDRIVTIERKIIKVVNMTPYNFSKHGMNMTSLEFIFQEL